MSENTYPACDLCSLPVENPDFSLMTTTGPKQFCCEGCYGIYQMLHEAEIVSLIPSGADSPGNGS